MLLLFSSVLGLVFTGCGEMNSLMAFQEKVDKAVAERKASSKSIAVSDDGASLVMHHSYFDYLVKVPYFNVLSKVEQDEVLRIFRSVDLGFFAEFINYHYDNIRQEENSYSYVVDNVRYILSLPETGSASVVMKFLLLSAVGKMKFLSKRNIDLFFVESDRVMKTLDSVKETGRKISLEKIFALFDRELSLTIKGPLYLKNSEELFYLRMILVRWLNNAHLSFRETVMMQVVFGHELPAVGKVEDSGFSTGEIRLFSQKFADPLLFHFSQDHSRPFDPVKILFNDSLTEGLADTTLQEFMAYSQFFDWTPPLIDGKQGKSSCSLKEFKKKFFMDFSKLDRSSYIDFFVNNAVSEVYLQDGENVLVGSRSVRKDDELFMNNAGDYYFLFCLLNGDKDRFIDFMKVLNLGLPFQAFSKSDRYGFLNMVKEYSESEEFIPASLLFGLYGLDALLSD